MSQEVLQEQVEALDEFEEFEDTQKDKFLTFSLGDEDYGIEIRFVTEIIGIQPITEVPNQPEYIDGIINLRGKIIPVMDVRKRFEKDFVEYTDRTCIVVVEIDNICVGLIVDSVSEVVSIGGKDIVAPPSKGTGLESAYMKGIGMVGEEVKLLLDCYKLLIDQELEMESRL